MQLFPGMECLKISGYRLGSKPKPASGLLEVSRATGGDKSLRSAPLRVPSVPKIRGCSIARSISKLSAPRPNLHMKHDNLRTAKMQLRTPYSLLPSNPQRRCRVRAWKHCARRRCRRVIEVERSLQSSSQGQVRLESEPTRASRCQKSLLRPPGL